MTKCIIGLRHGKIFYSVLFMLVLFTILPVIMALIISLRSLSATSLQSEACLETALKMQMQYIQETRPARYISEEAASLNGTGLLEELGALDEMTAGSDLDTMEQRLQALYDDIAYKGDGIYLYFVKSAYLMGAGTIGRDARADAPMFMVQLLEELDTAGVNYTTTRFGTNESGETYGMHIECVAPSVFYIYIRYGAPPSNLAEDLKESLTGVEILFYDSYGTVHAATKAQTLIDLYDYDSLGDGDSGAFSFTYAGKPYRCFYQYYSNMDMKQAVFFVDTIAQSRHTVSFLLWISAAGLVFVFLLIAVFFTRQIYRPLDELITRLPADKSRGIRDDCRILSDTIDSMDSRLSKMDALLERSYLLRLLHGFDVAMYEDMATVSDGVNLSGRCAVAAICADSVENDLPLEKASLEKEISDRFRKSGYKLYSVRDGEFLLLTFCLSGQQSILDLTRESLKIQEEKTDCSLSVYISRAHDCFRELHTAYEEAIQTSEYCMLLEKFGTILCYDSISNILQKKNAASPDFSQLRLLSENISSLSCAEALSRYDVILTHLIAGAGRPITKDDMTFLVLANTIAMAFYDIGGFDVGKEEISESVEAVRRVQDPAQLRTILAQSMESFCRQNDARSFDRERFEQIKAYVCESFSDPNLCLNSVSERVGTCPSNITRMFKKYNQSGFLEYIHHLRVDQAIKLLKESDLAVSEIASRVGYTNTITMNRAFKNYAHSTPSLIRKKSRQKPGQ